MPLGSSNNTPPQPVKNTRRKKAYMLRAFVLRYHCQIYLKLEDKSVPYGHLLWQLEAFVRATHGGLGLYPEHQQLLRAIQEVSSTLQPHQPDLYLIFFFFYYSIIGICKEKKRKYDVFLKASTHKLHLNEANMKNIKKALPIGSGSWRCRRRPSIPAAIITAKPK